MQLEEKPVMICHSWEQIELMTELDLSRLRKPVEVVPFEMMATVHDNACEEVRLLTESIRTPHIPEKKYPHKPRSRNARKRKW